MGEVAFRDIEITITDFESCCRLCLSANLSDSYFDIANSNLISVPNVSLAEAVNKVASIEISLTEKLSTKMCPLCVARLDDAYCFIRDIHSNNVTLKTYFKEYPIEEQPVSEHEPDIESDDGSRGDFKDECEAESVPEAAPDIVNAVELVLQNINSTRVKPKARRTKVLQAEYECTTCSKKFTRRSNLIDHQRLHEQVKLYKCDVCEKSFVQAANLRTHYRIHTAEKPYICPVCDKCFNQSSTLKIHLNGHANIKPFACERCDKSFVSSSDLAKHKLSHSAKKGFRCVVCEKQFFTQKVHLQNHLYRHHSSRTLPTCSRKVP